MELWSCTWYFASNVDTVTDDMWSTDISWPKVAVLGDDRTLKQ